PCRPVARLCITLPSDRRVQKNLTTTGDVPNILRKERNVHLQGGADEPFRDSFGAIVDDGKYVR
ncbi:hypothetical protein, partial [Klebsiella pneumoniae]